MAGRSIIAQSRAKEQMRCARVEVEQLSVAKFRIVAKHAARCCDSCRIRVPAWSHTATEHKWHLIGRHVASMGTFPNRIRRTRFTPP
jgi:hypothetical protein